MRMLVVVNMKKSLGVGGSRGLSLGKTERTSKRVQPRAPPTKAVRASGLSGDTALRLLLSRSPADQGQLEPLRSQC